MAYEADLEAWCRKEATKAGGYLLKWVSPGNKGVPDRILLMPGYVAFIEFKGPKGELAPLQRVWQQRIAKMCHRAYVVRDKDAFLGVLVEAANL